MTQALLKAFYHTLVHQHNVYVNTGGFIERIIIQYPKNVDRYLEETKALGFDVVEVSSGMFEHANDFNFDFQIDVVKRIQKIGLKPKPEITIMSGVGGGVKEIGYQEKLKQSKSIKQFLEEGERFFEAGAHTLIIESKGITEGIDDPKNWRSDVIRLDRKIRSCKTHVRGFP